MVVSFKWCFGFFFSSDRGEFQMGSSCFFSSHGGEFQMVVIVVGFEGGGGCG